MGSMRYRHRKCSDNDLDVQLQFFFILSVNIFIYKLSFDNILLFSITTTIRYLA